MIFGKNWENIFKKDLQFLPKNGIFYLYQKLPKNKKEKKR